MLHEENKTSQARRTYGKGRRKNTSEALHGRSGLDLERGTYECATSKSIERQVGVECDADKSEPIDISKCCP